MLYSKNKQDKKLDVELFKNPTSDYRATPFWAWNCELDREELCRQIDIFKEMGYGGFPTLTESVPIPSHIHPCFLQKTVPGGISLPIDI